MNKITLYHGSPERVEQPLLAKGKLTNDYGQGFYCTENLELAKKWASAGNNNGVANCKIYSDRSCRYQQLVQNFAQVELSTSSPSAKTFCKCLVTTERSMSNNCPIAFWVSHTLPS